MQLITAAQNLTTSWVDLGDPVDMSSYRRTGLWINLDINDSQNARVRALGKMGKNDANEYLLPIQTVGASDIKVEGEYIEFNTDADQKMLFEVATNGIIPFVQFQVQVSVAGATPGQIDEADVTFSNL